MQEQPRQHSSCNLGEKTFPPQLGKVLMRTPTSMKACLSSCGFEKWATVRWTEIVASKNPAVAAAVSALESRLGCGEGASHQAEWLCSYNKLSRASPVADQQATRGEQTRQEITTSSRRHVPGQLSGKQTAPELLQATTKGELLAKSWLIPSHESPPYPLRFPLFPATPLVPITKRNRVRPRP